MKKEKDSILLTPINMSLQVPVYNARGRICGYDIGDDFESAVYHLNLQNNIDVEKEKVKVKKGVRDSSLYNKK